MSNGEPQIIWVRTPCPQCGAITGTEAAKTCRPVIHCPASDTTDDEDYIVEMTPESYAAWAQWHSE